MIRVFFDTEFSDLCAEAKLISIGFVDETGRRTFYAELCDAWKPEDLSEFTRAAVIPHLGNASRLTMHGLSEQLAVWLGTFGAPVKLATDSLAWDWPWIQEIFRTLGRWPENVDGRPLLLTMNYLNDYDAFTAAIETAFAGGLRRHHALDDAKANRLGWIAAGGDIEKRLILY